jgi:hypothetical protein
MLVPKYDDDKMAFIYFVQNNKKIFDELLRSGKYRLGTNIGIKNPSMVLSGYLFLRDLDDADVGTILYDDSDYYPDAEEKKVIYEFEKWLNNDVVKQKFKKEYNKSVRADINKKQNDIDEAREARTRVVERTNQIKNELLDIDYVMDNREKSVKGKKYRTAKRSYITNEVRNKKKGGKRNRTKKRRKPRR